jgi:hypothetical protein
MDHPEDDWTRGPDGRSNTSEKFCEIESAIEKLIRQSAFDLIAGHAGTVAGLIVAQLAHVHGVGPRAELLAALREQTARAEAAEKRATAGSFAEEQVNNEARDRGRDGWL